MPAITSTLASSMTEMARFDGVPPNMSVRTMTPSPRVGAADGVQDLGAAHVGVVLRTDGDGFELGLRPNDVLEGEPELDRQTPVRDDD